MLAASIRIVERWLPAVGFEGFYEVSDQGRVRSVDRVVVGRDGVPKQFRGRLLCPGLGNGDPRLHVILRKDLRQYYVAVHRLVLDAFVGSCPSGMTCRHGPGGKLDNRLENLRWDARAPRVLARPGGVRVGSPRGEGVRLLSLGPNLGENHGQSKLVEWQVLEIRSLYDGGGWSLSALGRRYGVGLRTISLIVRRLSWRHLP